MPNICLLFQTEAAECSKTAFDLFKEINDDFLSEVVEIIRTNPDCSKFVKCESASILPKKITA